MAFVRSLRHLLPTSTEASANVSTRYFTCLFSHCSVRYYMPQKRVRNTENSDDEPLKPVGSEETKPASFTTLLDHFSVNEKESALRNVNKQKLQQRGSTKVNKYREILASIGMELEIDGSLRPNPKLRREITVDNQNEMLLRTVVPFAQVHYEDQLYFKYHRTKSLMRNLSRRLQRRIPHLQLSKDDLVCEIDWTQPSPDTQGFRNKSELNVNCGADGNPKTVGFYVGRSREGNVVCVSPDVLPNTPESHKSAAKVFQDFIRRSPLPACLVDGVARVQRGFWRGITVRSNRCGDLMVSVHMHPQELSPAEIDEQKQLVYDCFMVPSSPGAHLNIKSLYFQACPHSRCHHFVAPYQHIGGVPHIYERFGDKSFRISPGSFYQINPGGAEVLYETIRSLLKPDKNGYLLDVCCGTGTIGIYLADSFRKVLGCDVELLAIDDAQHNAAANGVTNCEFFNQSAERAVPLLVKDMYYETVSAVLNPPRGGVQPSVIKSLRNCAAIDNVIYVSCKPQGFAMNNMLELCLPQSREMPGEPFRLAKVVPVDMFPHTEHCEVVMLFERVTTEKPFLQKMERSAYTSSTGAATTSLSGVAGVPVR